jgi:hypothetical protein
MTNRGKPLITIGSGENQRLASGQPEPSAPPPPAGVDLVFVIDTTGSMSDKIDGLLATCSRFAQEFDALQLNQRIAVMAFGDLTVPGDRIQVTGFTDQIDVTLRSLRNIPRFSGGGNEGESSLEALDKAISLTYRSGVVKVLILITDEPAHQRTFKASAITDRLVQGEFLTFTVTPPYGYFKDMAARTHGRWYRISANTDLSELLKLFQRLAVHVAQAVSEVYRLGDGSVADYRKLKPPEK